MHKPELISIIVPVYNVEKYLQRCVDSLVAQTYENIEIVLVDDGSTDKSGEICDRLAKKNSTIKVIHKANGGQSSARNAGLMACNGEYIGFIDSDDWVAADMYQYMVKLLQEKNAEGTQINSKYAYEYTMDLGVEAERINVFKGKEILQQYMISSTITGSYSVCRCLFKRTAISELRFREGKINEDIDFKYKALSNCVTFVESSLCKYFYFQSTGSTTTSGLRERDFDLYEAAEELYKLTKDEEYGSIRFLGEVKKARTAFSLLSKIAYYGVQDKDINKKRIIKKLTKEHRKNLECLLKSPMKMSRKLVAILLAINYNALKIPLELLKALHLV